MHLLCAFNKLVSILSTLLLPLNNGRDSYPLFRQRFYHLVIVLTVSNVLEEFGKSQPIACNVISTEISVTVT